MRRHTVSKTNSKMICTKETNWSAIKWGNGKEGVLSIEWQEGRTSEVNKIYNIWLLILRELIECLLRLDGLSM